MTLLNMSGLAEQIDGQVAADPEAMRLLTDVAVDAMEAGVVFTAQDWAGMLECERVAVRAATLERVHDAVQEMVRQNAVQGNGATR